jgi:hypothetical protein
MGITQLNYPPGEVHPLKVIRLNLAPEGCSTFNFRDRIHDHFEVRPARPAGIRHPFLCWQFAVPDGRFGGFPQAPFPSPLRIFGCWPGSAAQSRR